MSSGLSQEIEDLHNLAVSKGESTYIDPKTGYTVFTILAERKGGCCGYKCRHCPYGHFNVKSENRCTKLPDRPTLLKANNKEASKPSTDVVLFWSGGKDSFLALCELKRNSPHSTITLLTTFEPRGGKVPEQDVEMTDIFDQVKSLKLDLLAVPNTGDYVGSILTGLALVNHPGGEKPVLVFGDLHIKEVREWRETAFGEHGYKCKFPLFNVPYPELEARLFAENVNIHFSAVNSKHKQVAEKFKVGDQLTPAVMEQLRQLDCDSFGENGEFHTLVRFASQ